MGGKWEGQEVYWFDEEDFHPATTTTRTRLPDEQDYLVFRHFSEMPWTVAILHQETEGERVSGMFAEIMFGTWTWEWGEEYAHYECFGHDGREWEEGKDDGDRVEVDGWRAGWKDSGIAFTGGEWVIKWVAKKVIIFIFIYRIYMMFYFLPILYEDITRYNLWFYTILCFRSRFLCGQ